jgi:hypothetical protein
MPPFVHRLVNDEVLCPARMLGDDNLAPRASSSGIMVLERTIETSRTVKLRIAGWVAKKMELTKSVVTLKKRSPTSWWRRPTRFSIRWQGNK